MVKAESPLLFYLEIHIDDFSFESHKRRGEPFNEQKVFENVTYILNRLNDSLEQYGARANFMFREHYPKKCLIYQDAADNTLLTLEKAGNEVGCHCHGSRLQECFEAVRKCGIKKPRSICPGVIIHLRQGDTKSPQVLTFFREVENLGFKVCFDGFYKGGKEGIQRIWRPSATDIWVHDPKGKVVAMNIALTPMDWGMIEFGRGWRLNQVDYVTRKNFERVIALFQRALSKVESNKVNYFGISFHEHQFATDDFNTVTPVEEAFENIEYLLGELEPYVKEGKDAYSTFTEIYNAYLEYE